MPPPESDEKPAPSPLDAEREKLRTAGYTETEIGQILVARALGSPGHSSDAPTGQGVMSGTLSSVMAIGSYARGTVFTIRHDLATLFDRTAVASARVGAAAMLAFKVAVISVLAFAGWQEWQRHIISEPDIAKQQTTNLTEQAKNAERREAAIAEKTAAEANVAKEINEAQLRKTKAEECTARMKAIVDTQSPATAFSAAASLQQECDPVHTQQAEAGMALAVDEDHDPDIRACITGTIEVCSKVANNTRHTAFWRAKAHQQIGVAFFVDSKNSEAIEALTTAIKIDPNDDEALRWRAEVYKQMGLSQKAITDFQQVISLSGDGSTLTVVYQSLAEIYSFQQKYDLAIDYQTKAIEKAPGYFPKSHLYNQRGAMWSKKGDSIRAEADYARQRSNRNR